VQGTARGIDLKTSADLDQLVRYLEAECRRMHGQYMTWRDRLLAICDRAEAADTRRTASAP